MGRKGRKRFGFLEKALKAAGGSPAPGSRLGNYKDFKNDLRKIEVTKKLSAAERKRYAIALLPFNNTPPATPADEDRYRATITGYSNTGRTALTLTNAQLGYADIAGGNQTVEFYPALLKVFVPSNAETPTKTEPTSGITGKKYTRTEGASYSIPFGRSEAAPTESEQARRLFLTIEAKTGNGTTIKATSVSYEPEEFGNAEADVPALPG
jgi:hypothetical protein